MLTVCFEFNLITKITEYYKIDKTSVDHNEKGVLNFLSDKIRQIIML